MSDCLGNSLEHGIPLCNIFYEHTPSSADVLDNVDEFAEARSRSARLREPSEAELGAAIVMEDDEKFDDEGDRLALEIYSHKSLAIFLAIVAKRNEIKTKLHRSTTLASNVSTLIKSAADATR